MAQPLPTLINPFADDIVNDPRRVKYSVPGLNQQVAEQVMQAVELLKQGERPRYHVRANKALLVASPRAGFGKSHLIGNLFKQLSGKATLVNIRPFEDPETCWKSILLRLVQELNFPDRFNENASSEALPTQLELFAHGVFSQIVADHLAFKDATGNANNIKVLRKPAKELIQLKQKAQWINYLNKHIADGAWLRQIEQRLTQNGLSLRTTPVTWLKVLFHYAYKDQNWEITQGCLDWIQGEPIDEDIADAIGIREAERVSGQLTAGQTNELGKNRVLDLCHLAGFYRPFLICFDQTETYGKSPELARAWGRTITDLTDEAKNQQTFITVNVDPWEKKLRAHWEQASLDRLSSPFLFLEGIDREQAETLAEHRLTQLQVNPVNQKKFWDNKKWLAELFSSRKQTSVREFLQDCARRWNGKKAPPKTSLADLFARYTNALSAKPRRLIFDRDSFFWLISELALGLKDVQMDTVTGQSGKTLPRWRYRDKSFVFGFEAGTHHLQWKKFAESALGSPDGKNQRILVYLRTPELPPIPKATWLKTKGVIEQAKASNLLIRELTQHELVRLYAAQDFYTDALQGDLEWTAEEVANFLRLELAEFWQSILDWPKKAPVDPPPPGNLSKAVLAVVKEKKFLSVDDLLQSLPKNTERETVLGICGEITNIKIHDTPQMVVLQWQS